MGKAPHKGKDRERVFDSMGNAIGRRVVSRFNKFPNKYLPLGIDPLDGEDLINRGCVYRFISANIRMRKEKGRGWNEVVILLPRNEADRLNIEYVESGWWHLEPEMFPCNVLGDDGCVHYVTSLERKKTSLSTRYYAYGPIVFGFVEGGVDYLGYFMNPIMGNGMFPRLYAVKFPFKDLDDMEYDPRIRIFVELLMSTGDAIFACRVAYNIFDKIHITKKLRILFRNERIRMEIRNIEHEILEKALRDRGITMNGKEFIINGILDAVEKLSGMRGAVAQTGKINALDKLHKMIDERPDGTKKPRGFLGEQQGERPLELSAEQIKLLEASDGSNDGRAEIQDTGVDAERSSDDREVSDSNNVSGTES